MTETGIIGLIIISANFLVSYKGFNNSLFFDSYKFEIDRILVNKDYLRMISSGFLHINWMHLIFNMISLYAFSGMVETHLGGMNFLLVYAAGLLGGNLLALYVHRNHGDYSAVGASGAVCGVIFATIALFPGIEIGFFGLPFFIPGWIYGVLYVLYSIYGIRSGKDNIGHEAHLGGALVGMATAIIIQPSAIKDNLFTITAIALPTLAFIYLIITKPHILLVDNFFFKEHDKYASIDHKYNAQKAMRQEEIDKILDKINTKGLYSLTKKEKQILDEFSKQPK